MKAYDTVVIIDPSKGEGKVNETFDFIERQIAELSGKLTNIEKWGRRVMAYSIGRNHEGFYALVKYSMSPANVSKFKGKLRLNENVLREMTLTEQPYFPPPVFSQPVPAAAGEVVAAAAEAPKTDAAPAAEAPAAAAVEETKQGE